MKPAQINLVIAWCGILLGFLSGFVMGMFFHRQNWLGGYGSFKRRLYRLAHISCFGLGAVNFFFYLTVQMLALGTGFKLASLAFVIGAITMPGCCVLTAHFPSCRALFAFPVLSLVTGGVLTVLEVVKI